MRLQLLKFALSSCYVEERIVNTKVLSRAIKLPKTYTTTYSHGAKHNLRHEVHNQHFQSKHLPILIEMT